MRIKKIYDIYIDGQYTRTILAKNQDDAQEIAERKYPYILDDDLLEIKERKQW